MPPFDCCRGELGPDEDVALLNPQALLQRAPSLAFVALIAILDPPRDEAIEAVKVAHDAGITVKMITGTCFVLCSSEEGHCQLAFVLPQLEVCIWLCCMVACLFITDGVYRSLLLGQS
jgi:hypothetical protein